MSAHCWFSTETPTQTLVSGQVGSGRSGLLRAKTLSRTNTAVRKSALLSRDRIRPCRLVSSWNVCHGLAAMTAKTLAMNSSGTLSWNRSDIELTKIRRGRRQRNGWSSRSGRRVTSKPCSKWWPATPRNRSAKVSA